MFQKLLKWKWILLAFICYLLLMVLPASFVEKYYSNAFFLFVRNLLDSSIAKIPFPAIYIFIVIVFLLLLKWFLHFFKEKPQPFFQRIFSLTSSIAAFIVFFFVLWGFNYGRIPIEEKLNINPVTISNIQLLEETKFTIKQLENLRKTLKRDTGSLPQIIFINNIETISRDALNKTLQNFSYPYSSKIRGRFVVEDMFLVFSIGGQYLPYVGEANVDDAVFFSKKPFYLIHELAHGNGFTEEATCNFLAYVSCKQSGNVALEYSGELNYLLYLLSELKYRDSVAFDSLILSLPHNIAKDLAEIKQHIAEHTFKTAFFGDLVNNLYLKILGIPDGVKNYDKMLLLVYAWKHQYPK